MPLVFGRSQFAPDEVVISHTDSTESQGTDMQLQELLGQPQHLPTIPALVQNLIDSFAQENISVGEIARLISSDPGLSAKLLRLANSAYFRAAHGIGSVDDALKMLGIKMARNLVIGSGLTAAFKVAPGMDIQQFWRYSLSTACVARWLAGQARQNSELAFMVGLLHGIGQFAMRAGMMQDMMRIDTSVHALGARRALAEREALGFDHAEVGAELARQWHFPESIAHGVGSVPRPLEAQPESPVAALVHLAAWRARAEVFGDTTEELLASYPEAVANSLGIDKAWMPALVANGGSVNRPNDAMPDVAELTAGLDEMLTGTPPTARQATLQRADRASNSTR
jgi:putative nucleotidyltransferase with HDIG domain